MEAYRRRASLDPLRAVLDEGDERGIKNAYIDRVERHHVQRALGQKQLAVAVDLGCGVGRLTPLLAARARTVIALDASQALLLAARRHGLPTNARLVRGDLGGIPLRDASADLVFTSNVLIHATEGADLARAAAEITRVLRPGGRAILLEHLAPGGETLRREGIVYRARSDLVSAFVNAGLRLGSEAAIRKSPSRLLHWAIKGSLPRWLWGLAARLEPRLAYRGAVGPVYRDHIVVLTRRSERGE